MRKITVLWDRTAYTLRWLRALVWAEEAFYKNGYQIYFYGTPEYKYTLPLERETEQETENFLSFITENKLDIVFCAFHDVGFLGKYKQQKQLLPKLKDHCEMIVWLDTSDSSGMSSFAVLPYVDIYLKKQLLRDVSEYYFHHYGERVYFQYYHEQFSAEDGDAQRDVLVPKYRSKIGISWNMGFSDRPYTDDDEHIVELGELLTHRCDACVKNRKYDVHYRGSDMIFQRKELGKLLQNRDDLSHGDIVSKVSFDEYFSELENSRTVLSPYGWGEICFRDTDTFAAGAVLIKPDMDHLVTWPDWYRKGETYIPLAWDFSDFDEVMDYIKKKENYILLERIAENGRRLYQKYLMSEESKDTFVTHIISQIENSLNRYGVSAKCNIEM